MVITIPHPTGTVIAVDQRHSAYSWTKTTEVPLRRADYGGKLSYRGDGWLTATGNSSLFVVLALEALHGVAASDLPAISQALARLAPRAPKLMAERWPSVAVPDPFCVLFIAVCGDVVAPLWWNGRPLKIGRGTRVAVYPADLFGEEAARRKAALMADASQAETLGDLVRRIAREFEQVAALSDAMSPTLEMGICDTYLSGQASELATASDSELCELLREPPAPAGPGVWSRILAELEPHAGACR